MTEELYWVWLSAGLGPAVDCLDLLSAFEWNPYNIYCATEQELFAMNILTRKKVERLKSFPLSEAERLLSISNEHGWRVITPQSEFYPQRLLRLSDMPLVLYVDGDVSALTNEMMISVVGARKASDYGRAVARAISSALSAIDFTIVSGGALGVDSAAHRGALDENKPTVCVLGCGLGTRYLAENEPLREKIRRNGALISKFPPFAPASKASFPLRNRIISGMSLGTVVVEAGERSGSLVTARLAAEQGRDVFAVPGDLVTSSFVGTNNLIRNGARTVFSINDILEEYLNRYFDRLNIEHPYPDDEIIKRAQKYLLQKDEDEKASGNTARRISQNAEKLLEYLSEEPEPVDDIIMKCSLPPKIALSALTELEIYGFAVQLNGRRYKLQHKN